MFCPLEPIAKAKFSWSTAISIDLVASSRAIDSIFAGAMALITNWAGLSSKITISILSLPNSFDTACTLEPRIPTQAPTGSILPSLVFTAILDLDPGSLATPLISITSSLTSGTSIRNNSVTISGQILLNMSCCPRPSTSLI